MKTYRVVIHTKPGTEIVTEEASEHEDAEALANELADRIEDRDDPWKMIGHVTINFRDILAFEVEGIGAAA